MTPISFFDVNCMLGRRSIPTAENNLSDSQVLEALARAGIEGALVRHAYGHEYDPRTGNERLMAICRRTPSLKACFTILPEGCGDFPGGEELLTYLRQGGAAAVALYPRANNFGLGETWSGPMLSTLEQAGVPVLIELDQSSWPELDSVLQAHPQLQLIVLRVNYRANRWVFPMMARYPGLRLETGFYEAYRGLEAVAHRFGADRLLFGSGLPCWDPGGAMSPILYADLPEADRRCIAGEALRSLLWKGEAR